MIMSENFWQKLKIPFFVLAPMADVTDVAFRRIIAKYSKPTGPDVFWTEFVSADGLILADERGRKKLLKDLEYSESERPIVAQFFTGKPEMMERVSALALELGFDGIDINMGCPDKGIERQGAGAVLCKNPILAKELIKSAKRGVANKLPVSVKIRLGYNRDELEEWLPALLKEAPAAITIHARTRKEMSKVPARWERIARAVEIRNSLKSQTLIIGNGDVLNLTDAKQKAQEFGSDGVMLGRAIFGNPWLFSDYNPTSEERLAVLIEHIKTFDELLGEFKNFSVMKKHFKAYVSGWPARAGRDGAKELREKLMETNEAKESIKVIKNYLGISD